VGIEFYNVTELNSYSSNLYRSAGLVLMSYLKNNPSETPTTSGYLVKYHVEAQKCIDNASLVELVYASYVVTIYSIIGGESVEMAIRYCLQFCKSVVALTRKEKRTDEWIELLWRDVIASLYYVHRDTVLYNLAPSMESVTLWEELLETSYCLLVSEADIVNLPLSMTTEKICHKVKTLSVYMQIYLDQFLLHVTIQAEDVQERTLPRDRLYTILDRIIRLVSRLPNIADYLYHAYNMESNTNPINDPAVTPFLQFSDIQPRSLKAGADPDIRDTAVALLYAFARLLKNMLEQTPDVDETGLSALAICRLCASLPLEWAMEAFLVKRSLFWAGLILTETKLHPGQILFFLS